jgi:hypothetical protein
MSSPDSKHDRPGVESDASRPTRKKKKKRRVLERRESVSHAWIWWWGSLAAAIILTVAALISMSQSGYPKLASYCALRLSFALPISTIVFAVSMLLSNWMGAGVELVEFSTLIPKSLLLVLLANLVNLMPCVGGWIALGVWFIGGMVFFKLEAWETRVLVAFNWVLGWVLWLFVLSMLISAVTPKE